MMKKNYSFYKKTNEVYFSGEIAFPIVLILIASLITYGLLYFLEPPLRSFLMCLFHGALTFIFIIMVSQVYI